MYTSVASTSSLPFHAFGTSYNHKQKTIIIKHPHIFKPAKNKGIQGSHGTFTAAEFASSFMTLFLLMCILLVHHPHLFQYVILLKQQLLVRIATEHFTHLCSYTVSTHLHRFSFGLLIHLIQHCPLLWLVERHHSRP